MTIKTRAYKGHVSETENKLIVAVGALVAIITFVVLKVML